MALESVFDAKFDVALKSTYVTGLRGAWIQGLGNGLMNGLIYFVEGLSPSLLLSSDPGLTRSHLLSALLFWVIAILMCDGSYTYSRALQVFSLVIFSLTFGAKMLQFRAQSSATS